MTNITQLGKELRKLRLDVGQTLFEMATAIGVSSSMLSSIETGKKPASSDVMNKLASMYPAVANNRAFFDRLADETKSEVRIRLTHDNVAANSVAHAFARNFEALSAQQLEQLLGVLDGKKKGG